MSSAGSMRRTLFEHAVSILAALFLVFFVRSTVYESYKIPSGSMVPTILIGDHVFVSKFAYQVNLPFSEYFGDPIALYSRGLPERGDIIVFESPRNPSVHYIKRVVGLPGEVIRLQNRVLSIDGKAIPTQGPSVEDETRITRMLEAARVDESGIELMREDLGEVPHWIALDRRNFVSENFGPYTVPEGKLFVMGDNRDFSDDSRFLGPIEVSAVRGRASWIWLSIWLQFGPLDLDFRPSRTGRSLYSL